MSRPKKSTQPTEDIPEEIPSQVIIKQRIKFERPGEIALGLILTDQYLFSTFFQKADLSLDLTLDQKLMFCDESKRILLCTSRNVAKTVSIIGRVTKDISTYLPSTKRRDDEVLVFTPAESQMSPLADRIFSILRNNLMFKSLIKTWNRRTDAPKLETKNGLKVHLRIEGTLDDRNMTGLHPYRIYGDECAFSNYQCHRSRAGGAMPHTMWLYAGVPNGVRGTPFYDLDQTHSGDGWSRHKFSMKTGNPMFVQSPEYAKEMEELFGGQFSPDYHTQVLGQWGTESISSFPAGSVSFNKTVGQKDGYKYYIVRASGIDVEKAINNNRLRELFMIPSINPLRCVIGWDYGHSPDPSTFLIATQDADDAPWKTYARISLFGVLKPHQMDVLQFIWEVLVNRKCVMLSLDNKLVYQDLLSDEYRHLYEGKVKLTAANSTVEIDTVTGKMVTDSNKNDPIVLDHRKDGKIVKDWRKYLLTEMFKRYMLNFIYGNTTESRLELGYDTDFESELIGTIERRTESHVVYDTPRVRSNKNSPKPDQIVDAARALVDAILVTDSEKISDTPIDTLEMLRSFGWTGKNIKSNHGWKQPWNIK